MTTRFTVTVPDLGDFEDVEVVDLLAQPGDELEAEAPLLTLETDKATMDVPTPVAGKVVEMLVGSGDRVSSGSGIAVLEIAAVGDADQTQALRIPDSSTDETVELRAVSEAQPVAESLEIRVPDIGEFADVEVIDVMVSEGDDVEVETALLTLETDKAAMDVPSPYTGKLVSLVVSTGDKVSQGDLIGTLFGLRDGPFAEATAAPVVAAAPVTPPATPASRAPAPAAPRSLPPINEAGFSTAHASPSVRRLARELGVDLGRVTGTGVKNRVTSGDVKAFVKSVFSGGVTPGSGPALPETPRVDFARFGEVAEEPLTRIQRISGPRLQAAWINLPHVTQHDEADFTATEERRQKDKAAAREKGVKLTPLAFIMRACVLALQEFPRFNTSLNAAGDALVYKKYIHMGFAADTPGGLVVPVVHDADKMSLYDLATRLAELAAAAREGKIKTKDIQGGTFTISSLGGIGGTAFTPIINAPEVAILGVSKAQFKPIWNGSEFEPRLMLPLSLSYDHRVIDGAAAARFTTRLGELLADPDGLLGAPG